MGGLRLAPIFLALALACGREPSPVAKTTPSHTERSPLPKPVEAPAPAPPKVEPIARDLDAIGANKTLRVLFTFNSTGYFVFRGETPEPVDYVERVMDRFEHYKAFVEAEPVTGDGDS